MTNNLEPPEIDEPICPKCLEYLEAIEDGWRCSSCGWEQHQNRCIICGKEIRQSADFCLKCKEDEDRAYYESDDWQEDLFRLNGEFV